MGYTETELLTMVPSDLVAPELRQMNGESVAGQYELEILRKQRDRRWLEVSASAVVIDGKKVILSMLLDITRLQTATLEVARQHKRLRAIFDSTADGIITITGSGRVETVNASAEALVGYAAEEVIGHNISMLMPSPDREAHDGYLDRFHQSGEAPTLGRERGVDGRRKDGTTFPMTLRVRRMAGAQPLRLHREHPGYHRPKGGRDRVGAILGRTTQSRRRASERARGRAPCRGPRGARRTGAAAGRPEDTPPRAGQEYARCAAV